MPRPSPTPRSSAAWWSTRSRRPRCGLHRRSPCPTTRSTAPSSCSPRSYRAHDGTMRHFLEVDDLSADELVDVLARSELPLAALGRPLAGKGMALYFEKPSLRTRHSAEMAVVQLGGHPLTMRR